jgi:hypothetical protein
MEDGVSLIEPAGLRVNEVGKGASGKRRSAIANSFGIDVVDGGSSFGIEQRSFGCHVDRRAQSCNVKFDDIFKRKSGMEFDEALEWRKGFTLDSQTVAAERKIASDQFPGIIGRK